MIPDIHRIGGCSPSPAVYGGLPPLTYYNTEHRLSLLVKLITISTAFPGPLASKLHPVQGWTQLLREWTELFTARMEL
ncbi:hypothetical protein KUCAC02_027524 [Chaenocephalus aceratus]|uniref:Uncharacterized protein n=1 Tax=Chaenocephalus aceratus TaxID=36190 RepID=A0ACB9W4V8_CHAAC|nr:hypothetical protein KUCAC02_027524 [Chaenocephalus aceratus]